jgi:nitrilase
MRAGIAQLNSGADRDANLATLERLLGEPAAADCALVVLPENFALMGVNRARRAAAAERAGDGPIQSALSRLARRHGCWIVAGTIPLRSNDPERPYASCLVYDSQGEQAGRYDKIHLFDVEIAASGERYAESSFTTPGTQPIVLDTPWGRLGIAVCYDLRFPEQFRAMAAQGLDCVALPAAFTRTTGAAHWEPLLRSRAIENQCAILAAAQTGRHPDGRSTWGHSLAVDAWGEIRLDMGDTPGIACVNIDFAAQAELRRDFPALRHRRSDIF